MRWERQALLDLRLGDPERAVAAYARAGRIAVAPTPEAARSALVADWDQARRAGGDCLMIAARRREATLLSREARELLVASGEVRGPALTLPAGEVAVGDRVLALRNDRRLRVHNGLRGTVTGIDTKAGALTVVTERGERRLPRAYLEAGHLTHGYAVTAHKAQGLTVDQAFVLLGAGLSREWGYTALSRARGETLYLASDRARETAGEDLRTHRWEPEPDPVWELARDLERSEGRKMSMDLGL